VRRAATGIALALLGLTAGLVFIRPAIAVGYDGSIMLQVAEGLVRHGSPVVHDDGFGLNSPYSSYGLGLSLLEMPLVALADHLGRSADQWAMAVNPVVLALLLPAIFALALELEASPRQAAALALIGAFAMPLIAYTPTPLSELGTALGATLGLLGMASARRGRWWGSVIAGAGSGIAVLMRPDSFVLVLPLIGLGTLILDRRPLTIVRFAAGLVPFLAVFGWYDWVRFGAPWRLGYGNQLIFNHPFLEGIYGLLLSPAKSLLIYVPTVLLALVGTWWALRRWPVIAVVAIGLLVVRILFYASWWAWDGGWSWGPRFLVPAVPGLLVPTLEVIRRLRRAPPPAWLAVASILVVSTGIQLLGALYPFGPSRELEAQRAQIVWDGRQSIVHFVTDPRNEARVDALNSDWSLFPVPDQAAKVLQAHGTGGNLLLSRSWLVILAAAALACAATALFAAGRPDPR
jgi:hypothetical protein